MLNGISAITIGQSHIDNKIECQDYTILDLDRKDYIMGAVADGHGSKKHFRSASGSEFAAEAAKESIYEYMKDYEKFVQAYNTDKQYLVNRIIKMLIAKWHEKIQEDINKKPITQEEIDKNLDGNLNNDKIASIYGTTLLVGVMSEKCNFGFLIGDGSFVVIDKHGKAYIPIEDENSKANYTTSLSSSDSFNGFAVHFFDEMPFSIMLSTDGLVKSFGNDNDFLDYNQAIAMELGKLDNRDKMIEMEDRLVRLFEQRSRDGSEDDISISVIFNSDAYEGVIKALERRRKINKLDEQIELSKKKILTLDFKVKQIIDERNSNKENINNIFNQRLQLEKQNEQLKNRKKILQEELKKLEQQEDELSKKKIKLNSEIEYHEEIEKAKAQEQEKNLAYKKLEIDNIKAKEEEKINLQNLLNS